MEEVWNGVGIRAEFFRPANGGDVGVYRLEAAVEPGGVADYLRWHRWRLYVFIHRFGQFHTFNLAIPQCMFGSMAICEVYIKFLFQVGHFAAIIEAESDWRTFAREHYWKSLMYQISSRK